MIFDRCPERINPPIVHVPCPPEVESKDSPWKMETISDPMVTHTELDHLDPSSHYIFKVIARTAAGDGPPIRLRAATLLEGGEPPPPPLSFTATS